MKYSSKVVFLLLFIIAVPNVHAQGKKFGLGVIIGEPTGISAKIWVSNVNALAFGLGWSVEDYRFDGYDYNYDGSTRLRLHVDYLWHSFNAISSNGLFPLYYGIGARINSGPQYSVTFGVRGVIGIEWLPRSTPLDIFLEVVPTLHLINSTGFGIDAGIGARFFF